MREHGTRPRYRSGCRCGPCRYAQADGRRAARPLGDAAVVKEHVRVLAAAGIGQRRLAALAGISARTLGRLLYEGGRPLADTVDKILAVQPGADPALRGVPALGTVRRLRALRTLGWTNTSLAPRLGVDPDAVSKVTYGYRELVRRSTAASAAAVYAELSELRPPALPGAAATRTRARQQLWFPPIAWDDDVLDDADALPCLLPPVEPVDRDLELLVQHLAAGHPVEPTTAAVEEVIRRMPNAKPAEIAPIARRPARAVANLRARMKAAAC